MGLQRRSRSGSVRRRGSDRSHGRFAPDAETSSMGCSSPLIALSASVHVHPSQSQRPGVPSQQRPFATLPPWFQPIPSLADTHIDSSSDLACSRRRSTTRKAKRSASAATTTAAAILVSSVLVTHPAFIATASAAPSNTNTNRLQPDSAAVRGKGKQREQPHLPNTFSLPDAQARDGSDSFSEANIFADEGQKSGRLSGRLAVRPQGNAQRVLGWSQQPSHEQQHQQKQRSIPSHPARTAMLPSYGPKDSADPGSHADVDDHLPPTLSSWADGTAASSGRKPRDRSTQDVAPDQTQHPDRLVRRATSSQALGLPSSYPSTIASSWSRPERSVWFQSKAIIITSIFLAIFIVLFIGAAVFLRDRKHDDAQLEESDEAQFEWMKSERRQAGLGEDGSGGDKEGNHPNQKGKRSKIKKALGLAPLKEKAEDNSAGVDRDTSTGSSSTVRRRHLASRWARIHARKKADSHETFVGSDTASIRSSRSNRRLTLGDPASSSERVEIIYDDNSAGDTRADEDARRSVSSQEGVSSTEAERGNEPSPPPRTEHRHADAVAGLDANDVHSLRAPPTPPPQSDPQQASDRNVGSTNLDRGSVLPRRREAALDHDDFQAAEEAEAEEHRAQQMPPAYLPSGSEATGSRAMGSGPPNDRSPYYGNASASMAHALAHGDEKSGIPPPDERDRDLPPEVLGAALRGMDAQYEADPVTAVGASTSRDTAHVAVDDKETLGALYAATSMPETDRPASMADVSSAPAYAPDAVVTAEAGTSAPSAPSAPEIDLDAEGFERLSRESARDPAGSAEAEDARSARRPSTPQGKGKGKIDLGLLPAPPRPLDPAFSPFDQPYRRDGPPNRSASSSPLPGSCPSSSWPLGGVESPSDANPSSVAKGKRPAEGASSASESDKQREAEAELAQYLASAPGDLLASAGIAPVSSVYLDRSAASAPAFESLPAYNRTDSSQPLLPSAPPSGDDDDDDDAGSRYEPFARLASSQASLGPSAPSQQGHLDESGETSEVGRRLPAPSAPSAPTPDLD